MAVEDTNPSQAIVSNYSFPETTSTTPAAHPQAAEIIRQVEFYFGDENLRQDAHLLALFQEGKGSVSLNEICGFRKMRKYKPRTAVREAIRQSSLVIVSEDGKRLSRKYPLDVKKITVRPKISEDRKKYVIPEDKPWLTKALMKPTGFEANAADGPIKPEEYELDRKEYSPDNAFTARIETAIARYCARRKMHETTLKIFSKFLIFGGMTSGQRQFNGGLSDRDFEDYTSKEIAELTSIYGVSEQVLDGLYEDGVDNTVTWSVDFEAVAKSFLSSEFLIHFNWYSEELVRTATNVLRNFYNYILQHDVCMEYRDQLIAARKVCDIAEAELPKLAEMDRNLPGGFNIACSALFAGHFANLYAINGDWVVEGSNLGWSKNDAEVVFTTNIFAHGNNSQLLQVEQANREPDSFTVVSEEELGLEIVSIELADGQAMEIYTDPKFIDTIIRPLGKLHCKRWEVPNAAPTDLPQSIKNKQKVQEFEFLIEESTLKLCAAGMKIECCVRELDIGIKWIDYVQAVYPSYYTWLPNERIREWKKPGPPLPWMRRQRGGNVDGGEAGKGDADLNHNDIDVLNSNAD